MNSEGLSAKERSVLARLRAGDPAAADRLASLNETSQRRVVAALAEAEQPAPNGGAMGPPPAGSTGEESAGAGRDEDGSVAAAGVVQAEPHRRIQMLGAFVVLAALLVLTVGGYVLYGQFLGDNASVVVEGTRKAAGNRGSGSTNEPAGSSGSSSVEGKEAEPAPVAGKPTKSDGKAPGSDREDIHAGEPMTEEEAPMDEEPMVEESMAEEGDVLNGMTHRPVEVKVAVVNGTGERGLAGELAEQLNALGYVTGANNAVDLALETSVIYYRTGYGADAAVIADALGAPHDVLAPAPRTVLTLITNPAPVRDFDIFVFYATDRVMSRADGSNIRQLTSDYDFEEPIDEDEPAWLPGWGVSVTMARAFWSSGYFQAQVYNHLLEELGYDVSDPSHLELNPSLAYLAMADGDFDFWVNSWYPGHLVWHESELPDGSVVGDHLTIVGEEIIAGGLQGFLVTKSFADAYGVYTMDALNDNASALAAFDATDPMPGNGAADIFGCPESWTCDNIIENQIAFSGWDNIVQTKAHYDGMFAQAVENVNEGIPMVLYIWAPSAYSAPLRPGDNVYWMGVDEILDDSNPANQPDGEHNDQRGADGTGGVAAIGADKCPSATDQPDGRCKIGWISSDIRVTANSDFLEANPAAAKLLEVVRLSESDVSLAISEQNRGGHLDDLASEWIAQNRAQVNEWIRAALSAANL